MGARHRIPQQGTMSERRGTSRGWQNSSLSADAHSLGLRSETYTTPSERLESNNTVLDIHRDSEIPLVLPHRNINPAPPVVERSEDPVPPLAVCDCGMGGGEVKASWGGGGVSQLAMMAEGD